MSLDFLEAPLYIKHTLKLRIGYRNPSLCRDRSKWGMEQQGRDSPSLFATDTLQDWEGQWTSKLFPDPAKWKKRRR